MGEFLALLQQDNLALLFFSIFATAVVLAILLVVLLAFMRIRSYKVHFESLHKANTTQGRELKVMQVELEEARKTVMHFESTQSALLETQKTLEETQKALQKSDESLQAYTIELAQTKTKLESSEQNFKSLTASSEVLETKIQSLIEKNNKLSINNARLLMKLDLETND